MSDRPAAGGFDDSGRHPYCFAYRKIFSTGNGYA
jgi:hypothetical protein